jgi:hypothetical protein
VSSVFLALLVVGLVLGVFAMLYGTERRTVRGGAPHERHSEHDVAAEPSPVMNLSSIAAFIFSMGLAGYLLQRNSALATGAVLAIATTVGLIAFALQSLLIARWAIPSARADHMDERYLLQGTIGTVTHDIPAEGEGAIRYVLEGSEFALPARNFEAGAIRAGTDIVIERIENGVAYVELWAQVEQRL